MKLFMLLVLVICPAVVLTGWVISEWRDRQDKIRRQRRTEKDGLS